MKQKLEEAARTHWSESTYNKDAELAYDERDSIAIKALAKSVALRAFKKGADWQAKQAPWISVEERLPENNTVVLTRGAYGFLICQLSSLGEWETGANVNKERLGITHWMPIPSFDEILEANRDVLERIKKKGD